MIRSRMDLIWDRKSWLTPLILAVISVTELLLVADA